MIRKNAKKRLASGRVGVKPQIPVDVFQACFQLEVTEHLKQWAVGQGGFVVPANTGLSHLLGLFEAFYGSYIRLVCTRTTQDSPQRAKWVEDDDFFVRTQESRPLPCGHGGHYQFSFAMQNDVGVAGSNCGLSVRQHEMFNQDFINKLPDELLLEIFSFLPEARHRAICASVSMRWLMLQSHMHRNTFKGEQRHFTKGLSLQSVNDHTEGGMEVQSVSSGDLKGLKDDKRVERQLQWAVGDLSRCLEGRKATDVRLAAIAVGTGARGGLGKLSIRGGCSVPSGKGVTDIGLTAIGSCCAALKVLSLWDCTNIGDDGLAAIGEGCCLLEKLDLLKCPAVGDRGLKSLGKNCPLLSCLNVDDCQLIGDTGLKAIGKGSPDLQTLVLKDCPLVGDDGVEAILQSCKKLKKVMLEGLSVGNKALHSLGIYGKSLVCLNLHSLDQVTEDGFVSFVKDAELQSLRRVSVSGCRGFSDDALTAFGLSCSGLKQVSLVKCECVSDHGLSAFVQAASSLEIVQVERCDLITGEGLISVLVSTGGTLREARFKKCDGIQDQNMGLFFSPRLCCNSTVKAISLANCANVGNKCLALVGFLCPDLADLDLSGLANLTDEGLLACLCNGTNKLTSVNLNGCMKLTDWAVCAIAQQSGGSLKNLVLDGCNMVTDKGILAVAKQCVVLEDLDVSMCNISDEGVHALVNGMGDALSSLNLSGCKRITDKVLKFIEGGCPNLLGLNLKHCQGLTQKAVDSFISRLWKCDVLNS